MEFEWTIVTSHNSSGVVAYGSQAEMEERRRFARKMGDKVEFIGPSGRKAYPQTLAFASPFTIRKERRRRDD